MNSTNINIIEFPSNLGLKRTNYSSEPGVKKLPDWLRQFGFHKRLKTEKIFRLEPPNYSMDLDEESEVRNADKIINYAIKQSKLLLEQLNTGNFQIIVGGDCSILIGNSIAFKKKGEFGLFFLDGHTDFIWPELSQTGGAAGMDLAIVTGYGHEKFTNIQNLKPYFKEENVFCVGNREYDKDYLQPILNSKVNYYDLKTIRSIGLNNTAIEFLQLANKKNLDGFFIHLDLDVLNDDIMPAVDSRAKDGLNYGELFELLSPLMSSRKAIGIEITILDPDLDKKGKFAKEFIENFVKMIEHGKAST